MWRLERESAGAPAYHFLTATDYIVGRKNCAILIGDDQSISRAHATFSVSRPLSSLGQPGVIPTLTIKDSSKYGTFINEEKMEIDSSRTLKSGDKVTFGVYNSTFKVMYEPLVACSSCLNGPEKSSLTQSVLSLGGHVVNNWTPHCTHLVMTSVKVTIKTLCALICGRSIIKPDYFTELIKAIQQKKPLPALASFFPIIDEPSLQSESLDFSENKKRRTVFKDKTVLFLTAKQHKKLSAAIYLGGGKTQLLTGELDDKSLLENPDVCVIDVGFSESQSSESQDFPTWITSIVDVLRSKGLRTIPEAEIGLAVIYMSTEKYCNPRQGSADRDEAEKNGGHNIMGSSMSSSMAVDETVLPPATFNTTAYVANTEPQDHTENWMEISGVREVRETPKSNRRSSKTEPRKDPEVKGDGSDCRIALFQEQLQERPRAASQAESPAASTHRVSQKTEASNKIQNYFQPMSKKRDREEEKGETSTAKLCRTENVTSHSSQSTKEILSQNQKKSDIAPSNARDTDLHTGPAGSSTDRLGNSYGQDKMDTFMTSQAKDSFMKKRKEPKDVVEESDVENEDCSDGKNTKSNGSQMKRPRVGTTEDFGEDFNVNSQDRGERATVTALGVQKVKNEPSIKQEPVSQNEETTIPFRTKQEKDEGLPSKLLLSEFRSLVVGRLSRNSQTMNKAHQENGANFKKFRKIAYPGAGRFPHIIGGSDLIAHDRKKNSELEQWLRQEMEEQTQQAREQSLADDLFSAFQKNHYSAREVLKTGVGGSEQGCGAGYNPRTVKKRR
ncbi:nibrin isoform X2 [Phyllobates terribilis]|uniref:nibrin isoform X2 n=1 Tax=Phyllobates terribilis TaxID=111132 RepID=UPI003CCAC5FF